MNKEKLITTILKDTGANVFNLGSYSYNERLAYVSMIVSLAWADGSIDSREKDIIDSISETAGNDIQCQIDQIIEQNREFDLAKYDNWVGSIKDKPLKIALMVDMFLTAFADSVCMQSETIYMKYIAGKLGIDDELYNIIRKNVEEYLIEKIGENKAVEYEEGLAHERENREETVTENVFRKVVNSFVKSMIMAL